MILDDGYAPPAPELDVAQWFNTEQPLRLTDLRGKVVLLYAFQMLCPGCVKQATPQVQDVARRFAGEDLIVIGLHTVFEHHDVMTPAALQVYIQENRLGFPIGVDRPEGQSGIPATMRAYAMEGTPTLVLIDKKGRLRLQHFGQIPDIALGAALGTLLTEAA